jgi:hypothetical protein
MKWKKQGPAVVGVLELQDGRRATVVLVGSRSNPKGAALVMPSEKDGDAMVTIPLQQCLHALSAKQVIDITMLQERVFGSTGLTSPFSDTGE